MSFQAYSGGSEIACKSPNAQPTVLLGAVPRELAGELFAGACPNGSSALSCALGSGPHGRHGHWRGGHDDS